METINDGSETALAGASLAAGDKLGIRDVSAITTTGGPTGDNGHREITATELAIGLALLGQLLTALVGTGAASNDTIRVFDVSANVTKIMTLDELKNALAALAQALTALTGINVADVDTINVYDASAAAQKLMTMAEFALGLNRTTNYTADGAISKIHGTSKLSKTSAGAHTLAAPSAAEEGLTIVFTCGTAFAHVITATGLIDDGVTGGAKNTLTMGAFVGATATLRATNGHWNLVSKTVATVA